MDLTVDDRENAVIIYLEKMLCIKKERITVGDYVYSYNGNAIVIVERKTLCDLSASIKDGRMSNHDKLLEAQTNHKCHILYIIEGPQYPGLEKKFNRIPYKCLQGKLDSLLFRNNIKIIWTKDAEHTAKRLTGLCKTFESMVKDGVFDGCLTKTDNVAKVKHAVKIDQIHIQMLKKIPGISYKSASAILNHYNIKQILTGQTEEEKCYNIQYIDSGFKLGGKGVKIHKNCKGLNTTTQEKILSCIPGITCNTASIILKNISFENLITLNFETGSIKNLNKSEKRKIGNVIENKVKLVFLNNE